MISVPPSTKQRAENRATALNDDRKFVGEAMPEGEELSDYECPYCHKLQFKALMMKGSMISTRCTRRSCKRWLKFRAM